MRNILIVDDNPQNLYLLETLLGRHGYRVTGAVNGVEALEKALSERPDMIISDILMPKMDGFELCREWKRDDRLADIPFVFFTATYTDPKDEKFALGLGAERFIVKPQEPELFLGMIEDVFSDHKPGRLVASCEPHSDEAVYLREYNETLIRKLEDKMVQVEKANRRLEREVAERMQSERGLRESEEKFRVIFEESKDGIVQVDVESRKFHTANSTFCDMVQYSLEEIRQLGIMDIHPEEDVPWIIEEFDRRARQEPEKIIHIPVRRKDGSIFWADIKSSPVTISGRHYILGNFRDVTQLLLLEKQVRTAQKMEAVGTLAGGIAHDFNNALTGIVGFGELLRMRMAGDEKALHDLDEIMRCAERASTLTRQLLTFARRQVIEPVNMDLSALVADLMKLIGKVVGEHIEVKTHLGKNVPTIRADCGQIEQVVMNLCLNSRDAMPEGGRLTVETEDVSLDEEYVRQNPYMKTGRFALLTVSDTGTGMDEKTCERVFEPFFTTKDPDKGTGLGLSMVYGIVKQHGGFIHLYSEPGTGTTFKVYFPAIEAQPDAAHAIREEEIVRGGTETILLAEDEESIRSFIERALKELGYDVLVARNGDEAIGISRQHKEIALALLDVVMPRKGGKEAFEEMHRQNPRLKVIFMSGYAASAMQESFVLTDGVPFLQKPFGPTTLARKVREVLDTQ